MKYFSWNFKFNEIKNDQTISTIFSPDVQWIKPERSQLEGKVVHQEGGVILQDHQLSLGHDHRLEKSVELRF